MISVADLDALATRTSLDHDELRSELSEASASGWVVADRGALSGWSLTGEGRDELQRALRAELDRTGAHSSVESAYQAFLLLNAPFLELCTAWQLRTGDDGEAVVNDHSDAAYDRTVIGRLEPIHVGVAELLGDLTTALDRFGGYRPRFERAWERLADNDVDWFTRPLIDSYHTVWFELHEDLLATLGRTRSSEQRRS